MQNPVPGFLPIQQPAPSMPGFMAPKEREYNSLLPGGKPEDHRAMLIARFEMFFPRLLDRMCAGETLTQALKEFPLPIERGAFMRWIRADGSRHSMYKDAKEVKTEFLTARMISIAEGIDENGEISMMDIDRAKLQIDVLKWLIPRENKKDYGDSKQIEVNQNISIVAALQAGEARALQMQAFMDEDEPRQIAEAIDVEWQEDD